MPTPPSVLACGCAWSAPRVGVGVGVGGGVGVGTDHTEAESGFVTLLGYRYVSETLARDAGATPVSDQ